MIEILSASLIESIGENIFLLLIAYRGVIPEMIDLQCKL